MNRTRVCTPEEARNLLEGLKTAYTGLNASDKSEVKEHVWEQYTDQVLKSEGYL